MKMPLLALMDSLNELRRSTTKAAASPSGVQ